MGNDGWAPVAVRVFAFSVLPVLLAALHVRLDTSAKDRLWEIEVYLIYLFMLGVGASGLSGFFGHVFTPDAVAESIGWPKGNPFQQEMGFANLALGALGLIAAARRDGFREATVIAVAIVGVGATLVHVIDILQEGDLAAGNSIQNVANLLKPALLIPMLIVSRRSEPAGAGDLSFDRWRMTVVGTAGIVTAVVGTGFGIGSSLELAVPENVRRSCPCGRHRGAVGEHRKALLGLLLRTHRAGPHRSQTSVMPGPFNTRIDHDHTTTASPREGSLARLLPSVEWHSWISE